MCFNDCIGVHKPFTCTRSSEAVLLSTDFRAQFVYAGERNIAPLLPKLWNSVPLNLHSESNFTAFKRKLKKNLFKQNVLGDMFSDFDPSVIRFPP